MGEPLATTETGAVAHTPKYKRLTDDQRVLILQLTKAGKTQPEIAQVIGCDQATVSRWLSQCQDTTLPATAFLRGSALRMARNIVQRGRAADHIKALEGINVLATEQNQGITVHVGRGGLVNLGTLSGGLSPLPIGVGGEGLENP